MGVANLNSAHHLDHCITRVIILVMSDGRSEHAGPQSSTQVSGVKVLETLKKHIFEHGDSSRYPICIHYPYSVFTSVFYTANL